MSNFIPAGEIIGDKHLLRTVTISADPSLPDGEYTFIDTYCTDLKCDCRKTIFLVHHNDIHVSTVDYGWATAAYYRKWAGNPDDDWPSEMVGVHVTPISPDRVSPEAIEILIRHLLDEKWKAQIKRHYLLTRLKTKKVWQ